MNSTKRMRPLLGTFVEIGVLDKGEAAETAITEAFAAIRWIQFLLSFHDPASDLSRLNHACGKAVALKPPSLRMLHLARAMTRLGNGYFNCTVGGYVVRKKGLPSLHGFDALDAGDYDDIEIVGDMARLKRPVLVTLDGIAKGYAVDMAVAALLREGIESGWVNAGGDMRVFGAARLPVMRREAGGGFVPLCDITNQSVATSSVNNAPDERFPGLIAPVAGCSPQPGAWSVAARYAWRADALTKVASLAPEHEKSRLISRLGGRLLQPEKMTRSQSRQAFTASGKGDIGAPRGTALQGVRLHGDPRESRV